MTKSTGIRIREITKSDFPSLINLFKEFASFEKQPEKMVNTVELMERDKNLVNGFVAETDGNYKSLGAKISGVEQNCDLILR